MAEPRHLDKAPIREALIDIQITPPVSLDAINGLSQQYVRDIGRESTMWQATFGFNFDGDAEKASSESKRAKAGKRFDSSDKLHVLQCRTNGLTFSRLAPYEDWDQIRQETQKHWETYAGVIGGHARVTRIAVRYINAMAFPLPMTNFSDYLVTGPTIPTRLPQLVAGFLQRVVLIDSDHGNFANVTQALDESGPTPAPGSVPVLLDIEAFRQVNLAISDTANIFEGLGQLRDFKNRIFFEYLTEKAVELFE